MKIQYNTEVFEFDNYDELDEYIVVDDNFKSLYKCWDYFDKYKIIKVWKDGKITNNANKELKYDCIIDESKNGSYLIRKNNGHIGTKYGNGKYWIYGKNKFDRVLVSDVVWETYSLIYFLEGKLIINSTEKIIYDDILYKDYNFTNCRLDNLIYYKKTNKGTKIFDNKDNYFDFNLVIERDIDDILVRVEPVILDELPDLEVYSNGKVIDRRGKSVVLRNKNGYETISYKSKNYVVHRLVAKSYLKNKDDCNLVNHIDGNRSNNDINNLEWVNNTINTLHGGISIKLNNQKDFNKFINRSSGVNGWISLTSRGYRDFIKMKIIEESKMDVDYWIFSHRTPLFLLYIPFSRNFGLKPDLNSFYYRMFQHNNNKINNEILFNKFFGENNLRYNELFKGYLKYSNNTYQLIVECINEYIIPKSNDDHLINILFKLGVDFDIYFDWLFDELKIFVGDDVGFIFFEEMKEYLSLLRMGDTIYVNDFLNRGKKFNDLNEIKEEGKRVIYFDRHIHRVIENIPRSFGDKFVDDTTKQQIKNYYEQLFFWDQGLVKY
jgi:hypothetical protein